MIYRINKSVRTRRDFHFHLLVGDCTTYTLFPAAIMERQLQSHKTALTINDVFFIS